MGCLGAAVAACADVGVCALVVLAAGATDAGFCAADAGRAIGAAPIGGFTGLSIALIGPGVPGSAFGPAIARGALALPMPTAGWLGLAVLAAEAGLVPLAAPAGAAEALPFAVASVPIAAGPPA